MLSAIRSLNCDLTTASVSAKQLFLAGAPGLRRRAGEFCSRNVKLSASPRSGFDPDHPAAEVGFRHEA
jgi:hypothetical protein